jgi:hypothetical protein
MCRNIKTLHNFEPPATEQEVHAAALQFIRKICGTTKPSKANQAVFDKATDEVAVVVNDLLGALVTNAEPKNREVEAARSRERIAQRFGGNL